MRLRIYPEKLNHASAMDMEEAKIAGLRGHYFSPD